MRLSQDPSRDPISRISNYSARRLRRASLPTFVHAMSNPSITKTKTPIIRLRSHRIYKNRGSELWLACGN
ncbi:hypothetical protein L873DRAFT_1804914 [Choiromyces venosus 120613-1]|uniref:Uncharacterized protein n=1 Tax=Choiromyces venosus 120613-1 TaxID=1336337 RepID=A0A3N4JTD6_9PEZI|nr:hypothetical protein L873DRAFT_1804914 [Choiromyces venosus 120613-1]